MVVWEWFFFLIAAKVTKLIFRYKTWQKFLTEILINFLAYPKMPPRQFNQILTRIDEKFHSFHLQWFIFHFRTITFLSHSLTRRWWWCQALIEKHPCSPGTNASTRKSVFHECANESLEASIKFWLDIFIFSTYVVGSNGDDVFLNRKLQYVMLYTYDEFI